MEITELRTCLPHHGIRPRVHIGEAISTRGVHYLFLANDDGSPNWAQRETYSEDGKNLFRGKRVPPPPALKAAIRSAVRRAVHASDKRKANDEQQPAMEEQLSIIKVDEELFGCSHIAESARGRRYLFSIHEGKPGGVFVEWGRRPSDGARRWLKQIDPPKALVTAVRDYVATR